MLIGLVGLKGSGKDTVARTLQYEFGFKKDSFAKPLKDAVASIFNWDRKLVEGDTAKSREWREQVDVLWSDSLGREVTPRIILQEMGTDVMRDSFHSDIWVDSFMIRNATSENSIVVSDVRFVNEMQTIKAMDGILIKVRRGKDPGDIDIVRGLYNKCLSGDYIANHVDTHRSEWDWLLAEDIIDYTIDNDGTLDDLQEKVRSLAVELGQSSSRLLEVTEDGIRYAE